MKFFTIILFLLPGMVLSGCRKTTGGYVPPSRIATAVDIYCQKPSGTLSRHYTDPGKVEAILHYVRLLDPQGPVKVTPEAMQGDLFEIVVHLQDGGTRVHLQRADSFAALHRRYWGTIHRSLGMRLPHLMALLPSDEVDANNTDMQEKHVTKS